MTRTVWSHRFGQLLFTLGSGLFVIEAIRLVGDGDVGIAVLFAIFAAVCLLAAMAETINAAERKRGGSA